MTTLPHNESDKRLENTQRMLSAAYNTAYKDIKADIGQMLAETDLTADNATQRLNEIQKYDRLSRIAEEITAKILEANKSAVKNIENLGKDVYQLNYNAVAANFGYSDITKTKSEDAIEKVDFYNVLAFEALTDKKSIARTVESALMGAVLLGKGTKSIYSAIKINIAKQLEGGVKIATTVTTQSENKAILDVGNKAVAHGKRITKVWRAVGDSKTRPAHRAASGQVRLLDEPFIVGGEKLMYPGDWSLGASAGNTINCRCVIALVEKNI